MSSPSTGPAMAAPQGCPPARRTRWRPMRRRWSNSSTHCGCLARGWPATPPAGRSRWNSPREVRPAVRWPLRRSDSGAASRSPTSWHRCAPPGLPRGCCVRSCRRCWTRERAGRCCWRSFTAVRAVFPSPRPAPRSPRFGTRLRCPARCPTRAGTGSAPPWMLQSTSPSSGAHGTGCSSAGRRHAPGPPCRPHGMCCCPVRARADARRSGGRRRPAPGRHYTLVSAAADQAGRR